MVGGIGVFVLLAVAISALLAWRSVTVERADVDAALRGFTAIRDQFAGRDPILRLGRDGRIASRVEPSANAEPATQLHVLVYRQNAGRLVRADVSFWFLKMKGPAVQDSLRGTGFDLEALGVTPAELQRHGRSLVLDETSSTGDRLLVWTE